MAVTVPGTRLFVTAGRMLVHPRLWAFLLRRDIRYALAWLGALATAALILRYSWHFFDNPDRPDGNCGHVFIDFAGQYVMGRMMVEGHARDLYNRNIQREVLRRAYPREDEAPPAKHTKEEREGHDDENLMFWFMGDDDPASAARIGSLVTPLAAGRPLGFITLTAAALPEWQPEELEPALFSRGGPLYPPISGFLCYPLARLRPQAAYRATQILSILLAFLTGLAVAVISRGRIWWPVAAAAVILFPGFQGNLNLGQNATLTLTILVWGWALLARGWPGAAGAIWGLLVFKPVWAAAFFLVPLITGRWRTALAMLVVGAGLAAATIPVVGWQTWHDWLKIGQEASDLYMYDKNWILLSRDILTLPRKMLDLDAPGGARRENLPALLIGWAAFLVVLEVTVRVAWFRLMEVRSTTGAGPAFLLLGAWICCFHFMYYDVLLAFLPTVLLFAEPRRYLEVRALAIVPLFGPRGGRFLPDYWLPRRSKSYPEAPELPLVQASNVWVLNRFVPTLVVAMLVLYEQFPLSGPPVEIYCLIGLWVWCAWLVGSRWEAKNPPASLPAPAPETKPVEEAAHSMQPLEAGPAR